MARNIRRTVTMCQTAGVNYRPHIKTHKIPALAFEQVRAGAVGVTCAKISEAEVMARAGQSDIFIAYPLVGRNRLERIAAVSASVKLSVGVDSPEAAKAIGEFFASQNLELNVLLEIETGHYRCGVLPERAGEIAAFLTTLRGLRLRGIFTHEGQVYAPGAVEERLARAAEAGRTIVEVGTRLRNQGIDLGVISVGSSPAQDAACKVTGITENRPGTNIFNDCTQVHLGACDWEDCALSFLCTVVSRPALDRAVIDGGSKTFSSDHLSDWRRYGAVVGYPEAHFLSASEEHGILSLERGARNLQVGQRVRVIPSHACGSINLHDRAYGVRGDEVVEEFRIEARGCVQ